MKSNHSRKRTEGRNIDFHRPKADSKPRSNRWYMDYGDDEEISFEREQSPSKKKKRNRMRQRTAFDEEYDFFE